MLWPRMDWRIRLPASFALSTLALPWATTPDVKLHKGLSVVNGLRSNRNVKIFLVSKQFFVCLVYEASLCCSLVLYMTLVNSCIALLTSVHRTMDWTHTYRCASISPFPLVKPPVHLMLLISTCSMIRSLERSAQYSLLWRTTCRPFWNLLYTIGWDFLSCCIFWRCTYTAFVYKLCPDAAKYGSISFRANKCRFQSPVSSAQRKFFNYVLLWDTLIQATARERQTINF